ncbi:hypothetical protein BpHYR1_022709 [Brachionus plicatilis]|uniref:Uncharacterized protein n=1 Tax=Brachionus plicatilis TaxID=10195 RepID=A0A3M7T6P1_BRAPC|nr:hypothetical protein BpHYR1_022709 [Brachionus plicatilis]
MKNPMSLVKLRFIVTNGPTKYRNTRFGLKLLEIAWTRKNYLHFKTKLVIRKFTFMRNLQIVYFYILYRTNIKNFLKIFPGVPFRNFRNSQKTLISFKKIFTNSQNYPGLKIQQQDKHCTCVSKFQVMWQITKSYK